MSMYDQYISVWKNIPGLQGRCNDVVYARSKNKPVTRNLIIFFGGDIQDYEKNMEKYSDKVYARWCLENIAIMLSEQFAGSHVFVVRPSRMTITDYTVFSCFDNFVPGDTYGTPIFCPMYKALKHLKELIACCLEHVKTLKEKDIDIQDINDTNITLMGFSKGCAVLNQFLYEFHYYDDDSNNDPDINNFIKLIKDMWWLDGGHNGPRNTWIINKDILHSFAKLGIKAHIHVTPYQMQDKQRPWIQMEEMSFNNTLQKMGVSVKQILHFDCMPRNILSHFNIITDLYYYK